LAVPVVLLGHLRELLEADAVVVVRVFHARLREYAGHHVRAEDAFGSHDGAVASVALVGFLVLARARRSAEQPHLPHLLDTDRDARVGFAGLDRRDDCADRRRPGAAGVRDAVDGNPGLADLLLDAL